MKSGEIWTWRNGGGTDVGGIYYIFLKRIEYKESNWSSEPRKDYMITWKPLKKDLSINNDHPNTTYPRKEFLESFELFAPSLNEAQKLLENKCR